MDIHDINRELYNAGYRDGISPDLLANPRYNDKVPYQEGFAAGVALRDDLTPQDLYHIGYSDGVNPDKSVNPDYIYCTTYNDGFNDGFRDWGTMYNSKICNAQALMDEPTLEEILEEDDQGATPRSAEYTQGFRDGGCLCPYKEFYKGNPDYHEGYWKGRNGVDHDPEYYDLGYEHGVNEIVICDYELLTYSTFYKKGYLEGFKQWTKDREWPSAESDELPERGIVITRNSNFWKYLVLWLRRLLCILLIIPALLLDTVWIYCHLMGCLLSMGLYKPVMYYHLMIRISYLWGKK